MRQRKRGLMTHFEEFKEFLEKYGIKYEVNPWLYGKKTEIVLCIGGNHGIVFTFNLDGKYNSWELLA